ncbi:gamma-glutamyl-phosphate reductase [Aerococcus urinaehominis]|uniref:Gamma-glutamyl phosphate reductase n=1 Tax=Aerococcus urinaehominis TaxID=128944 RepID=A0A0X8FKM2_9LACT|nr:glutamate-5-semialdehyde dehydrogenase [Aerococcus urinaehominis]AMB99058.1 gamma-glutamyl-phosphate reductase [Aerococcus urinaehominis]SDM59318.1 glutamate-5-semialdehyde dehydrogenase [Aerococcus urinaehominis]
MINKAELLAMGQAAKLASRTLRRLSSQEKNQALVAMANYLRQETANILAANALDTEDAQAAGRPQSFIDRMVLSDQAIEAMADGLEQMADLADPIGRVDDMWYNQEGLQIGRQRVPLGVVGIIFESRPNVTADAAGLCFKTGNAVILRGGKETIRSNQAILKALHQGLADFNLPTSAINLIDNPDRELAKVFMQMNESVDVLIPRGSAGLINNVIQNATVPTIQTGEGNCHLYVEKSADLDQALAILINGKTQKVSACNAIETLLVDQEIAQSFLSQAGPALVAAGVTIHGDNQVQAIIPEAQPATPDDWATEYLAMEIAIKVVSGYDEAIDHIEHYTTYHSETIVTSDYQVSRDFMKDLDVAVLYVNASPRFSDGEKFGFGGEIGISTQKLHARGPMGLDALTSYKYTVFGQGQVRP